MIASRCLKRPWQLHKMATRSSIWAHRKLKSIFLQRELQRRLPSDASSIQKLRMLNHFFYRELGFAGNVNDYYDARQQLSASRHQHAARHPDFARSGVHGTGAANRPECQRHFFSRHFLMKLSVQSGDIVLDPFNGASLSREELEERLGAVF